MWGRNPSLNTFPVKELSTASLMSVFKHHRLNGHDFEQALGVGDGQGGLACCGPWGRKESDTTLELNNNELLGKRQLSRNDMYLANIRS